ncbi:glycosyltransferase family 2 protein [Aggregatilinea lenta]|uniref:glycosyltransferase family 2 protein n=1 Tax=Aggregatilinea lenta TaxID=913108 RepID=UPI001EE8D849|nr:glycosyltransferase family 2 protein [Aggregatilinea lenta]
MEEPNQLLPHPIVAVIAAHNEDRFIGSVVLKASQHVDHVIVVDDGSQDATADIARAAGAEVLLHDHNRGKAEAVNTGLSRARDMGAALVVLLDADGQHDPNHIPALIEPIRSGAADVVVGSRFLGIRSRIPRWRIFGQHALTLATNVASGVPLTDSQSGYRALSRSALERLRFRPNGGFSIESEMQFLVHQHGLTIAEVPVTMTYEEPAKRNPFSHGLQVLNAIITLVSQHRPLFFFGVSGMILLLIGIALGLLVIDRYNTYKTLAVGYALISILLDVAGIQTLFTGVILHSIRAFLADGSTRT